MDLSTKIHHQMRMAKVGFIALKIVAALVNPIVLLEGLWLIGFEVQWSLCNYIGAFIILITLGNPTTSIDLFKRTSSV